MSTTTFFFEETREEPLALDFAGGRAVVFSTRAPDKERANEDAAGLIELGERSGVLAVADGLGGHAGGALAARTALETLATVLDDQIARGRALREALLAGFDQANRAVLGLGIGAATTLAVVEWDGERVRSYHAGDSPVLVFGGRGRVKLITMAHSPVGYAVEAGLLDAQDAMHHEARHLISNVIGSTEMHVDMSAPRPLAPRDTVLVTSDGLVDNMHTHEIVEALRKGPFERSVGQLVTECRRRMQAQHGELPSKPDDLTLIAFRPGKSVGS